MPGLAQRREGARSIFYGALIAALALGAYQLARSEFIVPYAKHNGQVSIVDYKLREDPWDHPKLKLLRRREKLDAVVAAGKTEFEKIVRLRRWARGQWDSASTFHYPPWDALEILDLARAKKNRGFCAQYAIVFLQACRSLGLHARYVDLGHFLTGVWSDEYNRWVVMDPTNDLHFERDGVPMTGRQLSEAAWTGKTGGIEAVHGDGQRLPVSIGDIDMWKKYSIMFNDDQMTKPMTVRVNGSTHTLTHSDDYRRYPIIGRDFVGYASAGVAWHSPGRPETWDASKIESDDPDNFNSSFNQTVVLIASLNARKGVVKIRLLADNAPDFETFLVRNGDGPYEASFESVVFDLQPGRNFFSARLRTKQGWLGPESGLTLYYKPDWLAKR